jgi:uncharacterized protein (TIGR04255 family)
VHAPVNSPAVLEIKLDEVFERFPQAPIVEAVIDIKARATTVFEEASVRSCLDEKLKGYGFLDSRREFRHELELETEGGKPPSQKLHDLGWKGLRFRSTDEKHIAQFNREGFIFSRLEPYSNWEQLSSEGLRLWSIFKELARPVEIHRLGLRFINRIPLPAGEFRFEDYIQPAPVSPAGMDLPFYGFMQHETLAVPGHPYAITVIRTIQLPQSSGGSGVALILDLDVFTTQGVRLDEAVMIHHMNEMRWLKNKAFHGSVTDKARELFR